MLRELRLRDLAVIRQVSLPLAEGFNVLSGETGAGKSIIVNALLVLLGDRASADMIRTGAEKAVVEGTFDVGARADLLAALDARGLDHEDGTVVLRREIAPGRGRAWINGTPVTAAVLAEIGAQLVAVHGQHEAQTLLDPASQRRWLDLSAAAGDDAAAVARCFAERTAAAQAISARLAQQRETMARADYLRHVADEIGAVRLAAGEDTALQEEWTRLEHADELRSLAEQVVRRLEGGDDAGGLLGDVTQLQRWLGQLRRVDGSTDRLAQLADEAAYALEELAREAATYADTVELDPERMARVQARRDEVFRLLRKYGPTVEDALAQAASAREALRLVDDAEQDLAALQDAQRAAEQAFLSACGGLSRKRRAAAETLAAAVSAKLAALGLADGRFLVALVPRDEPGATGAEDVEFRVALNPGHAPRALARVASGGELSRIMLALASVAADQATVPTLVFDEIDAGIGGRVGQQVGDALRDLAHRHQVFAITHLPQLAARAHHQIVVEKGAAEGVTTSDVRVVTAEDRVAEVARMLGGDPERETSRAHARELLAGGVAAVAPPPPPPPPPPRKRSRR